MNDTIDKSFPVHARYKNQNLWSQSEPYNELPPHLSQTTSVAQLQIHMKLQLLQRTKLNLFILFQFWYKEMISVSNIKIKDNIL